MSSDGSVTHWIAQLQAGDSAALEGLWQRYFTRLAGLARQKLRSTPRRIGDEEDAVLSAFDTLWRNVADGRYPWLADRDDLWRLLVVITTQKAANLARYEGRQKRSAPQPAEPVDLDTLLGDEPTPEFAAQVAEECQQLLGRLASDELRQVALLKMEGVHQRGDCGPARLCASHSRAQAARHPQTLGGERGMSEATSCRLLDLPADDAEHLDRLCDRFETSWRAGERPVIAACLDDAPASVRSVLLRELIAIDVEYRHRAGEYPKAADYQEAFPELASTWLAEVLPAPTPRLPRQLGRLRLLEQLGTGAFGVVYRAHDPELDRTVAVKVPHPGLLDSPAHRERFLREARAAAQLRHPGIVTVHEVATVDSQPVLVAEYVDGQSVRDFLRKNRPTFRETGGAGRGRCGGAGLCPRHGGGASGCKTRQYPPVV